MLAIHTDDLAEAFTEDRATAALLRPNKVRTARRWLAEGRYDREEVLDGVLEAILEDIA